MGVRVDIVVVVIAVVPYGMFKLGFLGVRFVGDQMCFHLCI